MARVRARVRVCVFPRASSHAYSVACRYRQLEERGMDLGRLPLCRFTRKHVRQAYSALNTLQFILNGRPSLALDTLPPEESAEIVTASYQFFAAVPHLEEPPRIESMDQVAYLCETVNLLAQAESAAELVRFQRYAA